MHRRSACGFADRRVWSGDVGSSPVILGPRSRKRLLSYRTRLDHPRQVSTDGLINGVDRDEGVGVYAPDDAASFPSRAARGDGEEDEDGAAAAFGGDGGHADGVVPQGVTQRFGFFEADDTHNDVAGRDPALQRDAQHRARREPAGPGEHADRVVHVHKPREIAKIHTSDSMNPSTADTIRLPRIV